MQRRNLSTCYMCTSPAVTYEHVPPKCLFPESKDLPMGKDLRKNLISVPSCREHNTAKSDDDTYFWYIAMICQDANRSGTRQFASKGVRSIRRNPSLLKHLLSDSTPAIVVDAKGPFSTQIITPDMKRLAPFAEMMARALYYHHFQARWHGHVTVHLEFLMNLERGQVSADLNRAIARGIASHITASVKPTGENPEIFFYRAVDVGGGCFVLRATIYGDANITMFFDPRATGTVVK